MFGSGKLAEIFTPEVVEEMLRRADAQRVREDQCEHSWEWAQTMVTREWKRYCSKCGKWDNACLVN